MASTWTSDESSVGSASQPDPPDALPLSRDDAGPSTTARMLLPLPGPDPSLLPPRLGTSSTRHASHVPPVAHKVPPSKKSCLPDISTPYEGTARWRELLCVYLALIADAICANVVAPYAQDWVRDTYHVDNVGLYSGILVGSFSLARALSSPFFGWLSDSMGRRLLIAWGLLAAGCLTMAGGLSQNFWMCFGFRFLAGVLNPTEVVATAAIGDLATGQARRIAFGYSKAASQIAKILTSMIGGFTYNLKPDPLFRHLPGYQTVLLSHLIAFGGCLSAVLVIAVFYREGPDFSTRLREEEYEQQEALYRGKRAEKGVEGEGGEDEDEENVGAQVVQQETAAIAVMTSNSNDNDNDNDNKTSGNTLRHPVPMPRGPPLLLPEESTLLSIARSRCHCWPSSSSIPSFSPSSSSSSHGLQQHNVDALNTTGILPILPRGASTFVDRPSLGQGVMHVLSTPLLVRLILVYSLTSFLNGGLFLSINLLALASEGFDMQPRQSSIIMLLFGCWATVFNTCFFKPVVRRLGSKRANALGLLATGVGVLGLPLADHYVRAHTWTNWLCIVLSVLVFGSGYMLVNSLLVGFISAHASADMQGITQGLAVFLSSSLSGLGPVVLGVVVNAAQEARLPVLSFLFLTFGYLVALLALKDVPRALLEAEA